MRAEDETEEELIKALVEARSRITTLEAQQAAAAQEQQRLVEGHAAEVAQLHEQLRQESSARAQAETVVQQLHHQLEQHQDELGALNLIAQTMAALPDLPTALAVVAETITHLFAGHSTAIFLLAETSLEIKLLAKYPGSPALPALSLPLDFKTRLIETKQAIVIPESSSGPWLELLRAEALSCLMAIPLVARGEVIGAIQVTATQPGRVFHRTDVALVETIAGNLAGVVETARLFAEERRLEEQLRQSQKMQALGQLAGGVAHHFNNMLTAIIGFVSLARETLQDHHPAVGDLERVLSITRHAATLTHQLLTFTRTQPAQLKITQLNAFIQGLVGKLQQITGEAIRLITHLAPDLDLVQADAGQVEQLLINVVVNARDAMPAGGELILETANITVTVPEPAIPDTVPAGEYIRLSVIDTGIGMSEETQTHIFEPFFTTKDVGEGTGLGLSTCFGIIRQHGGYITVKSAPGQGSAFSFYFPRLQRDMDLLPEVGGGSRQLTQQYPLQCCR